MEIFNNHIEKSYLKKFRNKVSGRRLIIILLLLLGLGMFGFASILLGAHLNSTGRTYNLKLALNKLTDLDFSFVPNTVKGQLTEINNINIDVKFKNWEKIRYHREKALRLGGQIREEFKEEVPAKIRFDNKTYKVKIKLTGGNEQHINHPSKWSLMVKLEEGKTIMGMTKFALLYPRARGYLTDWVASKLLNARGIIGLRSGFSNVIINGKDHGLYYVEERFDEKILENNKLIEGVIFRNFGNNLKIYDYKKIKSNPKRLENIIQLKKLWHSFLSDSLKPNQLFDLRKYASLYVISDLMYNDSEAHALYYGNSRMYFNPITQLIEPIPREWGDIRLDKKKPLETLIIENRIPDFYEIQRRIVDDLLFNELYFKEAEKLSKKSFLDSIINLIEPQLNKLTSEIHRQNPFYSFPINVLYENQNAIRKKLHPIKPLIDVYFDSINEVDLKLLIYNKSEFPIEIKRLTYNDSKIIIPYERIIISPKNKIKSHYQRINIPLNLNQVNFRTFSPDSLEVIYSILGIKETDDNFLRHSVTTKTIVFSKNNSIEDFSKFNITQQPSNFDEFDFIKVNKKEKIIEFASDNCTLKGDLVIPKGYSLNAKPGCRINLTNSAKIITYSPVKFIGTKENPIEITSSDLTGQGLVVLNSEQTSILSHVKMSSLSNISDSGWRLNGIITFYESEVNIDNCNFQGNLAGAEYLNLIRTKFNILESKFENINFNAIKSEYSSGIIEGVVFDKIGNDALLTHNSQLTLKNIEIKNLSGIGINGAQDTHLICENILINGGKIAVQSKDNARIEINNIQVDSSDLAYCVLRDKLDQGSASILIKNSKVYNIKELYQVDPWSILTIEGKMINNTIETVK